MKTTAITVIGDVAWLQHLQPSGAQVLLAGGGAGNLAVVASRLGTDVTIVSKVGSDQLGVAARDHLIAEGVDVRWLAVDGLMPTNLIEIELETDGQANYRDSQRGHKPQLGDHFEIAAIFSHDLVVIDVDDVPLYRFLVDLPTHTMPLATLMGSLKGLKQSGPLAVEIVSRLDIVIGDQSEFLALTGEHSLEAAVEHVQSSIMRGSNLRYGFLLLDGGGAIAFTETESYRHSEFEVESVDEVGVYDVFTATVAILMARRTGLADTLERACAAVALASTAMGAQSIRIDQDHLEQFIKTH